MLDLGRYCNLAEYVYLFLVLARRRNFYCYASGKDGRVIDELSKLRTVPLSLAFLIPL